MPTFIHNTYADAQRDGIQQNTQDGILAALSAISAMKRKRDALAEDKRRWEEEHKLNLLREDNINDRFYAGQDQAEMVRQDRNAQWGKDYSQREKFREADNAYRDNVLANTKAYQDSNIGLQRDLLDARVNEAKRRGDMEEARYLQNLQHQENLYQRGKMEEANRLAAGHQSLMNVLTPSVRDLMAYRKHEASLREALKANPNDKDTASNLARTISGAERLERDIEDSVARSGVGLKYHIDRGSGNVTFGELNLPHAQPAPAIGSTSPGAGGQWITGYNKNGLTQQRVDPSTNMTQSQMYWEGTHGVDDPGYGVPVYGVDESAMIRTAPREREYNGGNHLPTAQPSAPAVSSGSSSNYTPSVPVEPKPSSRYYGPGDSPDYGNWPPSRLIASERDYISRANSLPIDKRSSATREVLKTIADVFGVKDVGVQQPDYPGAQPRSALGYMYRDSVLRPAGAVLRAPDSRGGGRAFFDPSREAAVERAMNNEGNQLSGLLRSIPDESSDYLYRKGLNSVDDSYYVPEMPYQPWPRY